MRPLSGSDITSQQPTSGVHTITDPLPTTPTTTTTTTPLCPRLFTPEEQSKLWDPGLEVRLIDICMGRWRRFLLPEIRR